MNGWYQKMNKTKVLKEAFNRVNFLKKNPDLAGIIVGDGLVNRKKENFYPNGFGMIAWIFNEMYNKVDYRDGYRSHAFPGVNGPGYFPYVGFVNMLESRFKLTGGLSNKSGDVVTLGYFVEDFRGSEKDKEKESEEDAFRRCEVVDAMFYLGDYGRLTSIDVFGLDPGRKKFINITKDTTQISPGCDLFYHTLR